METSLTDGTVRLTVPAEPGFVRLVRLTTSGVASRLGFDVEEVEDLRVAVDELANIVLRLAPGGTLEVTFETATGVLRIVGEANTGPPGTTDGALGPAPPRAAVEDLTRRVLAAVVDEWDVEVSGGRIRFCCARRIPIRR